MLNKKIKIRLIPIFIFVAFLSLSIKVVNVYDHYNVINAQKVSISTSEAIAKDKQAKDTEELTDVLEKAPAQTSGKDVPAPSFTNSEIMIL